MTGASDGCELSRQTAVNLGEQTIAADWVNDSLACHTVDSKDLDRVPNVGPSDLLFAAFEGTVIFGYVSAAIDGSASHIYAED